MRRPARALATLALALATAASARADGPADIAAPTAPEAGGERVVASLNQNRISITAGFEGSEIFVFGAIAREAPSEPDAPPLGVVVRIAGPSTPVTVRRKERVLGVWANVHAAEIDAAPSFYAVATTGPLYEVISHTEDLRYGVSLGRALRFVGAGADIGDREPWLDAIVRLRRQKGLYVVDPGGVSLTDGVLFQASVSLPANIVEGPYSARVLLTRDREVIDSFETEIIVRKEGLERLVYDLARQRPVLYGLMSIAVALAAGFGASEVFRYLRR